MKVVAFLLPLLLAAHSLKAQTGNPSLAEINDAAAFLAGEPLPNQTDHPLTVSAAWQSHVAQLGRDFSSHRDRVLIPMSEWSSTEVGPLLPPGGTVRYLFSGPDILHAFHLFPSAETFILCGLEPVGEAPQIASLDEGRASRALGEVRNALGEIIQLSFFRTKDMKEDLELATFRGTTPLMMVFLAKMGQYVKELEFLRLQKDGSFVGQGLDARGANGVRLVFSPRRLEQNKTLYYFSADLSNGGFDSNGFGAWAASQPRGSAYLKAASYLMHNEWFSKVRQHLLDYSDLVVQDDSGIPYRHFDTKLWEATLYGIYSGPIELFKDEFQPDLVSAYRSSSLPLSFGTGYKWRRGDSNLMRFLRKNRPAVAPVGPAETPPPITDPVANPVAAPLRKPIAEPVSEPSPASTPEAAR